MYHKAQRRHKVRKGKNDQFVSVYSIDTFAMLAYFSKQDIMSDMWYVRCAIGLLFCTTLLLSAADGRCAEQSIDQQITERTKQYQESLRQRAAQLSPSLQAKIEAQAEKTVEKNTAKWKNGEISLRIALPRLAEARWIAQFVAQHCPFSGSPNSSFEWKTGICDAVLTVTSVQSVVKSFAISVFDSAVVPSFVGLTSRNNGGISYFVRIVCTIVQRQ